MIKLVILTGILSWHLLEAKWLPAQAHRLPTEENHEVVFEATTPSTTSTTHKRGNEALRDQETLEISSKRGGLRALYAVDAGAGETSVKSVGGYREAVNRVEGQHPSKNQGPQAANNHPPHYSKPNHHLSAGHMDDQPTIHQPQTDRYVSSRGLSSQAVRSGDLLFTSALDGRLPEMTEGFDNEDIDAQTRTALTKLGKLLRLHYANYDNVIKVTIFVVDTNEIDKVNRIYSDYFKHSHTSPARSVVQVAGFVWKRGLIEIEAVARLGAVVHGGPQQSDDD